MNKSQMETVFGDIKRDALEQCKNTKSKGVLEDIQTKLGIVRTAIERLDGVVVTVPDTAEERKMVEQLAADGMNDIQSAILSAELGK